MAKIKLACRESALNRIDSVTCGTGTKAKAGCY